MANGRTARHFRSSGRTRPTLAALASLALAATLAAPAAADDAAHHGKHHVAAVIGGTHVPDADETAFTLGLDYEYRLGKALGLGFVAEHAFGHLDSTTLLAVANIHLGDFVIQTGPGVEFVHDESFFVTRLGALYEFQLGNGVTIAPQAHYDFSTHHDAIVFGIGIGKAF